MKLHPKKRVEILVESPLLSRVTQLLEAKGALGYTVLPVVSGLGTQGTWSRDGMVGSAGQMMMVHCILAEERVEALLDDLFALVSRQIGQVSISDCQVIRPERF